jgi:hypothetical protein
MWTERRTRSKAKAKPVTEQAVCAGGRAGGRAGWWAGGRVRVSTDSLQDQATFGM